MASNINMVASLVHTISSHTGDINGVTFTHDKLATISADKTVRLWSTDDYTELPCSPLLGHTYNINHCSFSPSGTTLATCSTDGTVKLWDTKTGQVTVEFQHESKSSMKVVKFSPDSTRIVTGSDDDTICMWDLASRKLVRSYVGHEDTVATIAYSPDGHFLVSGSPNGDLYVWDAVFGHGRYLCLKVDAHDLGVTCTQFSPTFGTACKEHVFVAHLLLATGGKDNLIKLWTFQAQIGSIEVLLKCHAELPGHSDIVMSCAFSPSGDLLASGSLDKSVRLWDPLKGVSLFSIEACHDRFVTCCAFSVDSSHLASGSMDRTVKVWKLTDTNQIMYGLSGYEEPEYVESDMSSVDVPHPMAAWTVGHVVQWLAKLGLPQYGDNFKSEAIDGTELLTLTASDLASIGVEALGHKNKIMRSRDAKEVDPEQQQIPPTVQGGSHAHVNHNTDWKIVDYRAQPGVSGTQSAQNQQSTSNITSSSVPSRHWTVNNVVQWVDALGLTQYGNNFRQNAIAGTDLFTLTAADLEKVIGISAMGHRNKILRQRDAAIQKAAAGKSVVSKIQPGPSSKSAGSLEASHNEFMCPIAMEIMRDPVIAADGYTYERSAILSWFEKGKDRSPMTNTVLSHKNVTPNRTLKMLIQKHVEQSGN